MWLRASGDRLTRRFKGNSLTKRLDYGVPS